MQRSGTLAATCFGLFLLGGCWDEVSTTPEMPEPGPIVEGLTLVATDPSVGLSGTYAEGDLVVHFQTLPDAEGEGVSARWTDAQGFSIAIDFSGDPTAYALWGDEEPPVHVATNRAELLDLVVRGGAAVAALEMDDGGKRHLAFVRSLSAAIPAAAERMHVAETAELAELPGSGETSAPGGVIYANTGRYKQLFRVIDSGVVGAHQCTSWYNYYLSTNGYWYYYNYILNRNGHGDTPACDTRTCSAWSAPHGYKGGGKCGTGYILCGFHSNRHNCRSDAKWQQNWVMRNAYCSKTGGICYHPQGLFNGAKCSASTSCSSGFNTCL